MKIVALEAQNVKRLRAVSIRPDGSMVVIRGDNGHGKSSVLDSIAYALGGEKLCPPEVVHRGAEEAHVTLDLGDLVVTRRWSADGKSILSVRSQEGARYPSPQAVLDKLVGKISFDPLAFISRYTPAQQVELLRKMVGIDFSVLDAERKEKYEERTIVNRDVAVLRGAVAKMPEEASPPVPVDVAQLLVEQEKRQQHQKGNDAKRRGLELVQRTKATAQHAVNSIKEDISKLEVALAGLRGKLLGAEETLTTTTAAETDAQAAIGALVDPDHAEIRQRIADAEGTNARARAAVAREREVEKLAKKEAEVARLAARIEEIDKSKATTLAAASFPVPGLSFKDANPEAKTEASVTLNGLPLEQASDAEQLRVSLAVGIALNPKLKVLLLHDGSLLDEKSLRMVAEQAEAAGAQVWIEIVGKGGVPGVIIEDGSVEGSVAPAQIEARP